MIAVGGDGRRCRVDFAHAAVAMPLQSAVLKRQIVQNIMIAKDVDMLVLLSEPMDIRDELFWYGSFDEIRSRQR